MEQGQETTKQKVFVAMSGGVDSSVTAALLKEAGYDVTGVFIKVWQPPFLECTWRDERQDAMRVAAQLGIPFMTADLGDAYKRDVVDYMVAEYAAGRVPNPDVMCNRKIKFGALWDFVRAQSGAMIATGHYAQVREKRESKSKEYAMHAGVDANKDQSYFLWTLTQDDLAHTLFPVGGMEKSEVREHARRFGLSTAEKKDSQGVCFLGKLDMRDFLKEFIDTKEGNVLDVDGNVIGVHEGALLYTLGQRHGFTVTKKTPTSGPFYIVAKDLDANTLTVSDAPMESNPVLNADVVTLENVNWIQEVPKEGALLQGRVRYRQPLESCTVLMATASSATIKFDRKQKAVTAGQSVVLYDGTRCCGGGVVA